LEHTTGSLEGYVSSLDIGPESNVSFESTSEAVEKERKKEEAAAAEAEAAEETEVIARAEPESKPTPAMIRKQVGVAIVGAYPSKSYKY
jgi:hypothetical protein